MCVLCRQGGRRGGLASLTTAAGRTGYRGGHADLDRVTRSGVNFFKRGNHCLSAFRNTCARGGKVPWPACGFPQRCCRPQYRSPSDRHFLPPFLSGDVTCVRSRSRERESHARSHPHTHARTGEIYLHQGTTALTFQLKLVAAGSCPPEQIRTWLARNTNGTARWGHEQTREGSRGK